MSWRNGTVILCEILPIIRKNIPEDDIRKDFLKDLLELFLKYDLDPCDLTEIDDEITAIAKEIDQEM
jgi:hypothetical protein